MDFKQIQDLIKLVNESNIGEVTIEQKDFKITVRQKEEQITQMVAAPMKLPFLVNLIQLNSKSNNRHRLPLPPRLKNPKQNLQLPQIQLRLKAP